MAYYCREILAIFLVCLSVLYNNRIEGRSFVEVENEENKDMEGRVNEAHDSRIIPNFFLNQNTNQSDYIVHNAGYFAPSDKFHGTRARISVWGIPNVHPNSCSSVYIIVLNQNGPYYSMVAGFHVYPNLYSGNTDLRLFVGWTTARDQACYSITCQGFVLSNVPGAPVPGAKVTPLSTYDGEDHFVTLSIKKDEKTQDWSLYRDDNSNLTLIGWWPKTLFNNTFDYATKIAWVGSVFYPKNETSPPMGSGHTHYAGPGRTAYINHIKIFDQVGHTIDPYIGKELTDRTDCFKTSIFKHYGKDGYNFYYGGPSGCN